VSHIRGSGVKGEGGHSRGEGGHKRMEGKPGVGTHLAVNFDQTLLHSVHLLHGEAVLHLVPTARSKLKLMLNECECV